MAIGQEDAASGDALRATDAVLARCEACWPLPLASTSKVR